MSFKVVTLHLAIDFIRTSPGGPPPSTPKVLLPVYEVFRASSLVGLLLSLLAHADLWTDVAFIVSVGPSSSYGMASIFFLLVFPCIAIVTFTVTTQSRVLFYPDEQSKMNALLCKRQPAAPFIWSLQLVGSELRYPFLHSLLASQSLSSRLLLVLLRTPSIALAFSNAHVYWLYLLFGESLTEPQVHSWIFYDWEKVHHSALFFRFVSIFLEDAPQLIIQSAAALGGDSEVKPVVIASIALTTISIALGVAAEIVRRIVDRIRVEVATDGFAS